MLKQSFLGSGEIPACRDCGGLVKTATISFGQALPAAALQRAEAEASACDLFLVLGSSLQVYPAAGLPLTARRAGAVLAIVNREPTPQDHLAELVLHEAIGEVMTEVAPYAWNVPADH